jgi:3-oxoacyl-[acyl-carrier protein] reductase
VTVEQLAPPTEPVATLTRSVLVTGASRGIGAMIAARLAAQGHRVAGLSRSGDAPDGVLGLVADVSDPELTAAALDGVVQAHGPIEVLVSNAGVTRDGLMLRQQPQDVTDLLDLHLVSAWRLTKAVLPAMMRARYGRLVYIGSVVGDLGSAGQTGYAAAKAGLIGMSRSVAREYGSRGITANVVSPGFIDTDMTAELGARRAEILGAVPVGRFGDTTDVAAAVEFLTSDAASYITGAVIPVDGGLGMGR